MRNAKVEFSQHVEGLIVRCAIVSFYFDWNQGYCLKEGHTEADRNEFLESLDFEYDAGYGSQELFGCIWYTDGSYSERAEYDGAEWWVFRSTPEIPEELKQEAEGAAAYA
jgi:hypothetical protein